MTATDRQTGFFIPYRYRNSIDDQTAYPAIGRLLAGHEAGFSAELAKCDPLAGDLRAIPAEPTSEGAPRWRQDWFPTLDAAVAYSLVRTRRPQRIVEVGAGHSTRFLARAIADGGLDTKLTAIDPAPRAVLAGLDVGWIESIVQDVDDKVFAALSPGDMLSIDSSHILMPGSDVDVLINAVLPMLPAGLLVHVHDIMLPDPYPTAWAWRGYNEQQAVGPMLTSGAYRPLFASHYVLTRMADAVASSIVGALPVNPQAPAGSLWLEKLSNAS